MPPSKAYRADVALSCIARRQDAVFYRNKRFWRRNDGVDYVCNHHEYCEDCEEMTTLLASLERADQTCEETKATSLEHFLDAHSDEIQEYCDEIVAARREASVKKNPTSPLRKMIKKLRKKIKNYKI